MPITKSDIKQLASARMLDSVDGGGLMTTHVVQDGVENNIFPDIGTLDRARGALQLRKIYAAVVKAGTDSLMGAHVLLEDTPDDPNVTALLFESVGVTDTVAALVARINAGTNAYGTVAATGALAAGLAAIPVAAQSVAFVPRAVAEDSAGGPLRALTAGNTLLGWVPAGATRAGAVAIVSGSSSGTPNTLVAVRPSGAQPARFRPGTVSGTFTAEDGSTGTVTCADDGALVFVATAGPSSGQTYYAPFSTGQVTQLDSVQSVSITGEVLVPAPLLWREVSVPAVAGQVAYVLSIPAGSQAGTESIALRDPSGANVNGPFGVLGLGGTFTVAAPFSTSTVDRSTGMVMVVLADPASAVVGRRIVVRFAEGGQTTPLVEASLPAGGLIGGTGFNVDLDSGAELAAAYFSAQSKALSVTLPDGYLRADGVGAIQGAATAAGGFSMAGFAGEGIVGWLGVQRVASTGVTGVTETLPTNLVPDSLTITGTLVAGAEGFTATASGGGVFSGPVVLGTYSPSTGVLSISFAQPVRGDSLDYVADQQISLAATAELWGIADNDANAQKAIFRAGDVAVLHHSAEVAATAYANGNVIDCGRVNLADVRLIGANGVGIEVGFSANLAAGTVTVTDVTGWSQPVVVRHMIAHTAVVTELPDAATVRLNRPLTRAFPAGSRLSSTPELGGLQARVGVAFSQATWTDEWSDSRIGDPILPQFQQTTFPILVDNLGAVTERWALIFTGATAFRIVGEQLGQVGTGTTGADTSPANPAMPGRAFFTLPALGFGGGWSGGHVLRFNTTGAMRPYWLARSTRPSEPGGADSITSTVRGDIDA